jgi:hypothetical protein
LVVLLLLGLANPTRAQVAAGLVLEQEQFLAGEAVPVAVRLTNFSGQTLHLGRDPDWLRVAVERKDGSLVPRRGDLPVEGEFDLLNSSVATKRLDVAPYFMIEKPGDYLLTAAIQLPGWNREVVTKAKSFAVIGGTTLWEQDVGIPDPSGSNAPPQVRRYALQRAIHLKQLKLYVRVTDTVRERIYAVFPLGPLLTFSDPEKQIDRQSNLHVLYQTGARSFNYSVINPAGKLVVRQTYEYTGSRPTLRVDYAGAIGVVGGVRQLARDDLPAPEPAGSSTNAAALPEPLK